MTRFTPNHIITPAQHEEMEARARKLRSEAFRHFFGGLFTPRLR